MQDISAESGAEPSFELVEAVHYWEVPLANAGPMENPVRTLVCTPLPLVNGWIGPRLACHYRDASASCPCGGAQRVKCCLLSVLPVKSAVGVHSAVLILANNSASALHCGCSAGAEGPAGMPPLSKQGERWLQGSMVSMADCRR